MRDSQSLYSVHCQKITPNVTYAKSGVRTQNCGWQGGCADYWTIVKQNCCFK